MKIRLILLLSLITFGLQAQDRMSPELLWQLGRVNPMGLSTDGQSIFYSVSHYNVPENSRSSKIYQLSIKGGEAKEISEVPAGQLPDRNLSPDKQYQLSAREVKVKKVTGQDFYPDMKESNVYIYDNLNQRHWDTWEDGMYGHIFVNRTDVETVDGEIDIMAGEPFDCPQMPFGGEEDYCWSPDSKLIIYVAKKKYGTEYATSTNTDIYAYNIATRRTANLTEGMPGYDMAPAFSPDGMLTWLSMSRDGYEADKNDIYILRDNNKINLTKDWDGTVSSFIWSKDGKKIYFTAPTQGTDQIFELSLPKSDKEKAVIKQLTKGQFNITSFIGQTGMTMFVTRTDMNHANEIYSVDLASGALNQITHVNDAIYNKIKLSKVEKRMVKTSDGKEMLTWVIYPPDFDPKKKYPTLLYCQGGPQSQVSQFYSFRWNFQLMAAQGYIIVAPNRRGLPGFGVEWNEAISGDWGGQCMRDYLSAIDDVSKEAYVDKDRRGCIGASFGGYSVFYLAGIHENRFKSFISHDGVFNTRSMYGTTEELFFSNWDFAGPYWDKKNVKAQKTYNEFNPINMVEKWNTPMLIIQGGKDYRVPIGQGLEAFQAAQLRGIKSKLLFFPEENHWILQMQNAIIWQKEFYKWLEETVK